MSPWSRGSWFERVVALGVAVAIAVAVATGTGEVALLALLIGTGAIGIRGSFVPPPARPIEPRVLDVDVSERARRPPRE